MTTSKKVILVGQGPVTLRPNDHIATGGEGSVYRLNTLVVKIFTDPKKMIREDMAGKISLLARIKHPWIVAPQGIVTDERHKPVGYYMPYAQGHPLPRLFTNDFRTQIAFTDVNSSELADKMREVVQIAHDQRAVIVDGNENGWLAKFSKGKKPEPRIVDVDSWQIDRWKAKVIMPSIRDYRTSGFNELTDWFSWGIVTFQLYTGIHPYKGILQGYDRNDFVTRMKANASVFTPGVRLNRAVRDFSCIPPRLLSWYEREFQTGDRTKPPSPFDSGVSTTPKTTIKRVSAGSGTGSLVFDKLFSAPAGDPVRKVFDCGVALLTSNTLINLNSGRKIGTAQTSDCEVTRGVSGWLVVERVNDKIEAWYTEGRNDRVDLKLHLDASGIVRYQNRVFAITGQGLTELSLQAFAKPVLAAGTSWPVMIASTKFFEGVGVQDTLGAAFLVLPHDEKMLSFVKVPELDGLRVINAKAGPRFACLVTMDRKGMYHKIELTFAKDYQTYTVWQAEVDTPELVMALLGRGVGATVTDDGELVVFVPTNGQISKFKDKTIATDEPLFVWEDRIVLVRQGDVWRVSVAKKP